MRWLHAMVNGEARLHKAFWPGLVAYAVFNVLYLRIMGAAVVYERNLFENPLLADKGALELALPAMLLLARSGCASQWFRPGSGRRRIATRASGRCGRISPFSS